MRLAESIYPDLLPTLPGIPEPRVERALVRAAQELCRRARCWKEWTDPVRIRGTGEYDVEFPGYAQVEVVELMTVNGQQRDMLPYGLLPGAPEDARGANVVPGRLQFHVTGNYAEGSEIRFRVVLVPADNSPGVPDAVYDQYSELLAIGVRSICMLDRDKPWTDLQMAAVNAQAFSAGISRATVKAWRGYTDGTRRAQVRWC